jgi:hypothetical protein
LTLPYHYALTFNYDRYLRLDFYLSVLLFELNFNILGDKKQLYLQIFNYKKKLSVNISKSKNSSPAKFIQTKIEKSNFDFPTRVINKKNLIHFFKFLIDLLKRLKPDCFKLYLLFSFPDPYYNGLFLAYYYTFKSLTDYPELKAEINWQEVMFKTDGKIGGYIIPLKFFLTILKFIFSFKSLKVFWQIYKSN